MNKPVEFLTVKERYEKQLAAPFPAGLRGHWFGDKTATLLQSEIGGFVLTYLETNGSLGSRQRAALQQNVLILKSGLSELPPEGQTFFSELIEIGELVLKSAHDQPSF